MKKKLLLITILLVTGLFVSCSSDESDNKSETPVSQEPLPIKVTATSSEILIKGETLEITGTNFVNKNHPTKVFINDIEVTPKELTNSKILLSDLGIKAGTNTVKIQIQKINSTPVSFFLMEKGWNKLNALKDADINNSSIFDDSKTIFSFVDDRFPKKLEAKSTGYVPTSIQVSGYVGVFQMFDDKKGVLTNTNQAFYSNNTFETVNSINVGQHFNPIINGLQIGYLDNKSCILTTQLGAQIYTEDNGITIIKNNSPSWSQIVSENGGAARLLNTAFGKSSSNGKFYQIGKIYDAKKYGGIMKNVVMESETGYSNWIIKDSTSNGHQNMSRYKFLNIEKIVAVDYTNKTLLLSTDMLKTWTKIRTDVASIFLRTETQWYIQSGDKIFITKDSGVTWELELELPAGSVVNDIAFSKNKIIVSGDKGLHYLKIE
jgi:hypothetical protein